MDTSKDTSASIVNAIIHIHLIGRAVNVCAVGNAHNTTVLITTDVSAPVNASVPHTTN